MQHLVGRKHRKSIERPTTLKPCRVTPWGQCLGTPIFTPDLCLEGMPATSSGYTALNLKHDRPLEAGILENYATIRGDNWRVINWDGTTSRPLYDAQGVIFGALVGRPAGSDWDKTCKDMADAMTMEQQRPSFPKDQDTFDSTRGAFPAINVGIHHSQGTTHPCNLALSTRLKPIMQRLLSNPAVQRVAQWQDEAFKFWAPNLHAFYEMNMAALADDPGKKERERLGKKAAQATFPGRSVWPTAAFNFRPRAWCCRHRDVMDLAFGWCAILALGQFDPDNGGHLVLPDLRMMIRFPPGSTIMIPSATLFHSNTPVDVDVGESRISFTQYCPGNLFRWVDCGFCTEDKLKTIDPAKYKLHEAKKATNWEQGLKLFSNIESYYTL